MSRMLKDARKPASAALPAIERHFCSSADGDTCYCAMKELSRWKP